MQLKINMFYPDKNGDVLIPRSHWGDEKGAKYAVFEIHQYFENGSRLKVKHTTLSLRQVKELLQLGKGEKIEII